MGLVLGMFELLFNFILASQAEFSAFELIDFIKWE